MKDVWDQHALRLRRREELERVNDWLLAHPWWSRGISLWLSLAILLLAELLRLGLDALAKALA